MPDTYDYITLLCRLKAAQTRIKELESGERYIHLQELHQKEYMAYERKLRRLTQDLAAAHRETIRVRNYWFQVLEDMQRELEQAKRKAEQELKKMEKRALDAEKQRDDALDKAKEIRLQYYETAAELEEERGKNLKLRAQINRDYENSAIPSSKSIKRKKIANSREKTGRKPGGQPGHPGHRRKKQEPTQPVILLPAPEKVLEDSDFKKTGRTIIKQMMGIQVLLNVVEYHADIYYNTKTGERVHAAFPDGVVDEVNYDGSIRAFLFLLNNDCCVSIDKSRKFLSDLTGGKLNISKGMISKLSRDHDVTFYNYGADHQECLAHVLRYLKDSIENEPDRIWNKEMRSLLQEMIHFRNGIQLPHKPDPKTISGFEKRYQAVLETARREYGDIPANDYYRDGYNLFLRMEKYMRNHLLFLHDLRVPATNNEAERLLRNYKRKQAQAVTFRSFESIDYLCQCMSMLVLMRREEPANIFDRVSRIFG